MKINIVDKLNPPNGQIQFTHVSLSYIRAICTDYDNIFLGCL